MQNKRESVLFNLMQQDWLLKNSLWDYGRDVLYDRDFEVAKTILTNVYGYKDVNILFRNFVDQDKYKETLNTLFTYYESRTEKEKME